MKGTDFTEILRVINCMSFLEFEKIFPGDTDHYWSKKNSKGLAFFLMYLDNCNANRLIEYAINKMNKRR